MAGPGDVNWDHEAAAEKDAKEGFGKYKNDEAGLAKFVMNEREKFKEDPHAYATFLKGLQNESYSKHEKWDILVQANAETGYVQFGRPKGFMGMERRDAVWKSLNDCLPEQPKQDLTGGTVGDYKQASGLYENR